MNPKHSFELLWTGLVLGGIVGLLFIPAGIILIAAGIIQYFIFFRCPHCGKHLDRGLPNHCPNCGAELFWN